MKTPLEKISLAMLEWMAKSQEEALALVCTCGIMRFTFSRTPRGQTNSPRENNNSPREKIIP